VQGVCGELQVSAVHDLLPAPCVCIKIAGKLSCKPSFLSVEQPVLVTRQLPACAWPVKRAATS
jgi:hypothetical protein